MPFLLRVELPDVPGSLGRLATAIGEAGGDIEAIEIVEKRHDGTAVDDVLLEMHGGAMPDSDRLRLQRARRGPGHVDQPVRRRRQPVPRPRGRRGADRRPEQGAGPAGRPAAGRVPRPTGRCAIHRGKGVVRRTDAAPTELPFVEIEKAARLEVEGDDVNLYAGARIDGNEIVVIGRRGGPEFVDSELARLGHLVSLAASLARP